MAVKQLPLLGPLRGFAACMVVLFHGRLLLFPQWKEPIAGVTQLIENGYLWVDLFFILSGLVMAHVYARTMATKQVRIPRFLWLRLTRVYPLFITTMVVLIGWELFKQAHQVGFYAGPLFREWGFEGAPAFESLFTPAAALPSSLLLMQAPAGFGLTWNFAAWSLSVEWVSYLLFPLLLPLALTHNRWSVLAPLAALGLLAALVFQHGTIDLTSGAPAVGRGVAGFVIGVWLLRPVQATQLRPIARSDLLLGILFLVPLLLMHFTLTPLLTMAVLFSFVALVWFAASQTERETTGFLLLENRFTRLMGDLSYSIYLWHAVLLLAGLELLHYLAPETVEAWYRVTDPLTTLAVVTLVMLLLWGLSWCSYRYIERPAQRSLRRLFKRPSPEPAAESRVTAE
ncbi:acyltransferase [Aeromonas diversa CDC 2478-85]|uniref:Acyltransferase n=1 Tax=Aeromonas diversa CDC 2478-85 TaxID=1268237 RepID=N9U238_9GAMM|nr:acyltransferase [Aeromonas diversa]ENY72439.1 acyltransferase [Aeromonas diversa CDC 2478-85]